MRAGLYGLDAGFEGTTATGITIFQAPSTPNIHQNASASDVEELLETLPSLGKVSRLVSDEISWENPTRLKVHIMSFIVYCLLRLIYAFDTSRSLSLGHPTGRR